MIRSVDSTAKKLCGPKSRSPARSRPCLEILEDRTLPSVLTVTSAADSGPGTLRAVMAAALDQDTITFALPSPSTINLTSGTLSVGAGLLITIIGPGASALTVNGNNTFTDFTLNGGVTLSGMTITGGSTGNNEGGGGIKNVGRLNLKNCVIKLNAGGFGGGITNTGSGAALSMTNCVVQQNSAGIGGGIYCDGTGGANLSNCLITGNQAGPALDEGQGGGIFVISPGVSMTLNNCTVSGNTASGLANTPMNVAAGGGIEVGNGAQLTVINSTIDSNEVVGGSGSISQNGSNAFGGGINDDGVALSIIGSTISNNVAAGGNSGTGMAGYGSGGGICITAGKFTAVNSTIALNVAEGGGSPFGTANGGFGGGILWEGGTNSNITNCTVAQNNVASGSGATVLGSRGIDTYTTAGTINNSIVGSGVTVGTATTFQDDAGTDGLGPLANNGGPTKTMAIGPSSPAVDRGDNSLVTFGTDQRGDGRIFNGTVDCGAVEYQPTHFVVTAPGLGMAPEIKVYDATTGVIRLDFMAYESTFRGGVRVAVADVDDDGIPDIITVPGGVKVTLVNVNGALLPSFDVSAGRAPEVKVFSGADGSLLDDFLAYDSSFKAGLFVAAADISGFGYQDIIVAPDATGQSGHTNVRVFFNIHLINTGASLSPDRQFNAYAAGFGGGVRLAAADINGDGHPDVITGPGIWSGPDIRVFDGKALAVGMSPGIIEEFLAYDFRYFGGVFVAAGDVNGDGRTDIVTGTNGNGGPEVRAFSGRTLQGNPAPTIIDDFFAYSPAFNGGSSVAVMDVNGDGKADIITGAGPGGGPHVRIFDGGTGQQFTSGPLDSFMAYDLFFTGGVFVGGT